MIGRLFTLLSALSLVLCVGTCVMWARSYYTKRDGFTGPANSYQLTSDRGGMRWESTLDHPPMRVSGGVNNFSATRVHQIPGVMWAEHGIMHSAGGKPPETWIERRNGRVDYWLPTVLLLIAPLAWLWLLRRRLAKPRSGICSACGYDLRATPDRCPECGAVGK
jgi:hypothetical protein